MRVFKFLSSIVIFGFLFVQCKLDNELDPIVYYDFITEVSTVYNTDTISMGDTLWFKSEISGFLVDTASNKTIHFKDATIKQDLMVRTWNIENQNYQPDNASIEFRTYASYISYTEKVTMIGMYYYTSAGKYLMKFGVVFHKPGIYSVDADYLKFHNYYNNSEQYFGGGRMDFLNLNNESKGAYLHAEIVSDTNNIHLYNNLSESDKTSFQVVDGTNQSKYFFIKVNE